MKKTGKIILALSLVTVLVFGFIWPLLIKKSNPIEENPPIIETKIGEIKDLRIDDYSQSSGKYSGEFTAYIWFSYVNFNLIEELEFKLEQKINNFWTLDRDWEKVETLYNPTGIFDKNTTDHFSLGEYWTNKPLSPEYEYKIILRIKNTPSSEVFKTFFISGLTTSPDSNVLSFEVLDDLTVKVNFDYRMNDSYFVEQVGFYLQRKSPIGNPYRPPHDFYKYYPESFTKSKIDNTLILDKGADMQNIMTDFEKDEDYYIFHFARNNITSWGRENYLWISYKPIKLTPGNKWTLN